MFQFSSPFWAVPRVCVAMVVGSSASLAGVSLAQQNHAVSTSLAPNPESLKFDSVLSRYQPMTDQKLGSWREANDTVTRIGGWRTYLKEAQTPDAKTTASTVAPAAPAAPAATVTPAIAKPHAGNGVKP